MNDYVKNLEKQNEELLKKCNELTTTNEIISKILFNVMMSAKISQINTEPIKNSSGEFLYEFIIKPDDYEPIITTLQSKEEVDIIKQLISSVDKLKNCYTEELTKSLYELGKII